MNLPPFNDFHLCGGTSLALLFGHRVSVDIDLFSPVQLNKDIIARELSNAFPGYKEVFTPVRSFYFCYLDNIKTDFVYSEAPVISPFLQLEDLRMWSLPDIVAMKLNAIYGRGSKKDFWDIDELLNHYTLKEMSEFFFSKYPKAFEEGMMMSLVYFEDADKEVDPIKLKQRNWPDIKRRVEKEVRISFKNQ